MLIGTSWYSKTSSNTPRISTETSMKKNGSLLGSLSHQRSRVPATTQQPRDHFEPTLRLPVVAQKVMPRHNSNLRPREVKEKPSHPNKAGSNHPRMWLWVMQPSKNPTILCSSKKTTICISGGSNRPLPAEMQSCDRATSMKVTGYVTTSMKLTLPRQIPSPTIDAVM